MKKKQRSLIRQRYKLKELIKNIDDILPFQDTVSEYEHFHVPGGMFIEGKKTYDSIKKEFCRKWIIKTEEIIKNKPQELGFCKVIAMIDVPNYWSSQIIIFYNKEYYDSFWDRNSEYQVWEKIDDELSLARDIEIETELKEVMYKEIIRDEDYFGEAYLWFYGEVK